MTKEEIKAMIAQKIEGQGTNLDAASVLPTILNWIIDNSGGSSGILEMSIPEGFSNDTLEEAAQEFEITVEELESLLSGNILGVKKRNSTILYLVSKKEDDSLVLISGNPADGVYVIYILRSVQGRYIFGEV